MNVTALKMEILVLDFEGSQLNDIISSIEDNKYYVVKTKTINQRTISDWTDEHPLNKRATCEQAYLELFK